VAFTVSDVYNFEMPKYVYVQIDGVEKAARVEADTVERRQKPQVTLILKKGDEQVGEFNGNKIVGWWVQDERT